MIKDGNPKSIEILEDQARTRLGRDYPNLYYDRLSLIDPKRQRFVIDDISYRAQGSVEDALEYLMLACTGDVLAYDAYQLSRGLAGKVDGLLRASNRRKTVVMFPGSGAQTVKDLLPEGLLDGTIVVEVPTQRRVDQRGTVEGVAVGDVTRVRKIFSDTRPEGVIVIDDVIATGSTLYALREQFPGRNIEWNAAVLMSLSPIQRRGLNSTRSGVDGFGSVVTEIVYQGVSGIPAVNSLSTLTGDSEKSRAVRERYMAEYVADPDIFTEAVTALQEKMKGK